MLKEQVFTAVRQIVTHSGIEPREGFCTNYLSVALLDGVEVSIESRNWRNGVAVVRWHGAIVADEFGGECADGTWMRQLSDALSVIWREQCGAKADPTCVECDGWGTLLDPDGEETACACVEFARTVPGANVFEPPYAMAA